MVEFSAFGMVPVSQGSKRIGRAGGNGRPILLDVKRDELRAWREFVAYSARRYFPEPMRGPVRIHMQFFFERPKSHYRANGELRVSAPPVKSTKPDGDKLMRAVLDALTGIAYVDDSQVAMWAGRKSYVIGDATQPGVRVQVGHAF